MTSAEILALANPLLCAVFATAFLALWWRERSAVWIAIVALTYLSRAIGFAIFHFAPDVNDTLPVVGMHLLYTVSAITLVWGVCLRGGQRCELKTYLAIGAVGLALIVAASVGKDYNARLYVANACYGLILALGTQTAARKLEKDFLDYAIIVQLAFGAFQFFTRPMIAIMVEGSMTAEQYRDTPFYAVMVITLALAGLMMAVTLLVAALTDQMKAQRLDQQRDPLTGLQTRGPFEEDAIRILERGRMEGVPVSVIVADIDHFKAVNDTFGHQIGDNAIAAFGRVITQQVRAGDGAGRVGGEEFCVVAWNCDERAAESMADRIRIALSRIKVEGMPEDMRLSASFGVAEQHGGEGYGKLFARADAALYGAKKAGRNCVKVDGRPDNVSVLSTRAKRSRGTSA